jgi:hypothetical protein
MVDLSVLPDSTVRIAKYDKNLKFRKKSFWGNDMELKRSNILL